MSDTTNVKHIIDASAILTSISSIFHWIPWVELSGFLSSIWLILRMCEWIYRKYKKYHT